jgi:hypothetical protein
MSVDNFDTILVFMVFMSVVAAMPGEEERKSMTRGEFWYAVYYRFLNNLCINVKAINPSLGALSQKVDTIRSDSQGNREHSITETATVVRTQETK